MTVFNRISDIINSNVSAILDQAEDPEKLIKLITQEMRETIMEVRSASARHIAEKKQLVAELNAYTRETDAWEAKAELAVNKGRDDLAKAALREKSQLESVTISLEADLIHIDNAILKLKEDADQLELKYQSAKSRQKSLIVRGQTAKSRIKIKRQLNNVNFDNAFNRFDSYERKLDEMEGQVESFDLGQKSLSAEIDELQHDEHLTKELDALKSRMAQVGSEPKLLSHNA